MAFSGYSKLIFSAQPFYILVGDLLRRTSLDILYKAVAIENAIRKPSAQNLFDNVVD